jgi:hypothetical protein
MENRMCTLCYVDDAMKKNIAAHGATFREATKSPFGAEIGMLNLITAVDFLRMDLRKQQAPI